MLSETVARLIRQYERRYIPQLRHSSVYRLVANSVLLIPLGLAVLVERLILCSMEWFSTSQRQPKLSAIISGWVNLAGASPKAEALALKRANICAQCPAAQFSGTVYHIVVDNRTTQVRGMKCKDCSCPLSAKVRSINDSCPRGKW